MHPKSLENFALVEITLPNHTEELNHIEAYIKNIQDRFKNHKKNKTFTKKVFDSIDNYAVETLILIGELSIPALNMIDELENKYVLLYPNSPAMAKKLWLEHVDKINYRYDLLKNRCYKLIDDMTEELIKLKIKL